MKIISMEELFSEKAKQACSFIKEFRVQKLLLCICFALENMNKTPLKAGSLQKNKQIQDSFEFL